MKDCRIDYDDLCLLSSPLTIFEILPCKHSLRFLDDEIFFQYYHAYAALAYF